MGKERDLAEKETTLAECPGHMVLQTCRKKLFFLGDLSFFSPLQPVLETADSKKEFRLSGYVSGTKELGESMDSQRKIFYGYICRVMLDTLL